MGLSGYKRKALGLASLIALFAFGGVAHAQSDSFMKAWKANTDVLVKEGPGCLKGIDEARRLITLAENSKYPNDYIVMAAAGITLCAYRNDKNSLIYEFGPRAEAYEDMRAFILRAQFYAGLSDERPEVTYGVLTRLRPNIDDELLSSISKIELWWPTLNQIRDTPNSDEKIFKVHQIIERSGYEGISVSEAEDLKADYLKSAILTKADQELIDRLLGQLKSPTIAMHLLVDKRFDSTRKSPNFNRLSDLMAIAKSSQDAIQEEIKAKPNEIGPQIRLADLERLMKRPEAAIDTLNQAIESAKSSPSRYTDFDDNFPWLYSSKSSAFYSLGRYDEALAAGIEAASLRKGKSEDPSQTINLSLLYWLNGQYEDSLKTLSAVGTDQNSFAKGLILFAQGCSSHRLNAKNFDAQKTRNALIALGKDGQTSLMSFDGCLNDLDSVERAYLAMLRDPYSRTQALLHAQAILQPTQSYGVENLKWREQFKQILLRPRVAEALAELGNTIETPLDLRDFVF